MTKPKFVILIPVFNALSYFQNMIESLYEHTSDFLLYVLDDGSNFQTKSYIDALRPHKLLVHDRQSYFTRAVNDLLLAAYLTTDLEYFFVLNTDILLCDGWAETLLDHFSKDDRIILTASDHSPPNKNGYAKFPNYATGHCWCISRRCIDVVGLLDESQVHIGSDKNYCYDIMGRGYKVFRDCQLPIKHFEGPSWNRDMSKLMFIEQKVPRPRPRDIRYYL